MKSKIDDKELYKKFLSGNDEAFETLINKYKKNLIYFIYGYVKNEDIAEDLYQEVALYIFSHKESYNFEYSLKTYLYIIAKSKCLNYLKSQKVINNFIESYNFIEEEDKLLDDIVIEKESNNNIKKVLNKLKPDYQKAIYLAVIEDLSYKDIAQIMDKDISQVKNLVHRAKIRLRKLLVEENIIEVRDNRLVKVVSLLVVAVGLISCIGYATYTIVSGKELKPFNSLFGISFSDEYENYVQKYDEINEKTEDVSPYEKTDIKLISSMCSDGFVSIEFEVDLSQKDRELLRLDKSAMTDKDWENFKNSWDGISEEKLNERIEKRKKETGVNTVRLLSNSKKMELGEARIDYNGNREVIIDGTPYNGYGTTTTNKLNDYQYQIFLMYFMTDEMIKDKTEYTLSIDNIVLTNGIDISKTIPVEGKNAYFVTGGDNQKFVETDNKFDIKMERNKALENTKVISNIDASITHKKMTKKIDKVTVGPTQTIVKLSTEYKDVSLQSLSSAFYIENHISTIFEYGILDQTGKELSCWNRETKRVVTYSNGKKEEWSPGDIGNWKNFSNATMNLEEYIVFETDPSIEKILIKTSTEERRKDEEKHHVDEMVELDDMEIELK